MSDLRETERFLFGNPFKLNYVYQPYPVMEAGTPPDQGRRSKVFNVDNYNSSGYFYPIQICLDVKKAGHVDPLSLDTGCVNNHCFRYATTEPDLTWNIMDVIKPYRRFSPRRLFYIATTTLPAEPLQPVISFGRGPPHSQTHYG